MPQVERVGNPLALFLLIVLGVASCRDGTRTGPPDTGPIQVTITYVCGDDFDIHNQYGFPVTVTYAVLGTGERGELLLPSGAAGESTIRLTTLHDGPVQISYRDEQASPVANAAQSCASPAWANRLAATEGEWSTPVPWPVVAVHLHLLPSGRVLSWGRVGEPQLWDPSTGIFTSIPSSTMVFCSGHSFLADGRLLVTGGHLDDLRGLARVSPGHHNHQCTGLDGTPRAPRS